MKNVHFGNGHCCSSVDKNSFITRVSRSLFNIISIIISGGGFFWISSLVCVYCELWPFSNYDSKSDVWIIWRAKCTKFTAWCNTICLHDASSFLNLILPSKYKINLLQTVFKAESFQSFMGNVTVDMTSVELFSVILLGFNSINLHTQHSMNASIYSYRKQSPLVEGVI